MHSATVTLFIVLALIPISSGFQCGSGNFQNKAAKLFITLDCKSRLSQFDACCRTHDTCYDNQSGRSRCDSTFCSCLDRAAAGTKLCKVDAKAFCGIVKVFGKKAYEKAGKKRG